MADQLDVIVNDAPLPLEPDQDPVEIARPRPDPRMRVMGVDPGLQTLSFATLEAGTRAYAYCTYEAQCNIFDFKKRGNKTDHKGAIMSSVMRHTLRAIDRSNPTHVVVECNTPGGKFRGKTPNLLVHVVSAVFCAARMRRKKVAVALPRSWQCGLTRAGLRAAAKGRPQQKVASEDAMEHMANMRGSADGAHIQDAGCVAMYGMSHAESITWHGNLK